jgi:hypothetical protein
MKNRRLFTAGRKESWPGINRFPFRAECGIKYFVNLYDLSRNSQRQCGGAGTGRKAARRHPVQVETDVPSAKNPANNPVDLFRMGELAVETGISDLATNADHYLYGHPKASHGG